MKPTQCEYEQKVLAAAISGHWADNLRNHAASCPLCKEAITMTTMVKAFSGKDDTHALPDYRLIWLKGQFIRREKHLSALDFVALFGISFLGLAGFIAFLLWQFPRIFNQALDIANKPALLFLDSISFSPEYAGVLIIIVVVWWLTGTPSSLKCPS